MPEGPLGGPRPFSEGYLVINIQIDRPPREIPEEAMDEINRITITPPGLKSLGEVKVFTRVSDWSVNIRYPSGAETSIRAMQERIDNVTSILEGNGIEVSRVKITTQ